MSSINNNYIILLFFKTTQDWWNSNSFASYYRMWNVVVHDWLYAYIYRDAIYLLGDKYRSVAATGVFLLSAVVHEYILGLTFRFLYPALFFMFGGVGCKFFFSFYVFCYSVIQHIQHTSGKTFFCRVTAHQVRLAENTPFRKQAWI